MIDQLPLNCFATVIHFLPQNDKVSLTRVSRSIHDKSVPFLYRRLYLNARPHSPSDLDDSLGTDVWSVLHIPLLGSRELETLAAQKAFNLLVKSLRSNVSLCHYIKAVRCSWHIQIPTLLELIGLLKQHGSSLQFFDGYLDLQVMREVSALAKQLKSLDVAPPCKLPGEKPEPHYLKSIQRIVDQYDWTMIRKLTLHVDAGKVFENLSSPLRIESLTLNLRPDSYYESCKNRSLDTIFDVDTLKELRIMSWYQGGDINHYNKWRLYDFLKFYNVRSLTLESLVANPGFLTACAKSFNKLERLSVDFLFAIPIDTATLNAFRLAKCSQTLKYIDIDFNSLDPPLVSVDSRYRNFVLTLTCRCSDCRETFEKVIREKHFPTRDSLRVRDGFDINIRNFIRHMFKFFPILPNAYFIDRFPAIAYSSFTLQDHATKVNESFKYSASSNRYITSQDIKRLYYAQIHSLKKTFDYFNASFPQLEFLTINDLPTRVMHLEDQQMVNMPLFYSQGYTSNQKYLIVQDESLFD